MRIISGRFKGRIIKRPEGIRPTQNKVRKALFDILGHIEELSFLDLYAGSGAIGLEALSQGVSKVVFVEKDRRCCRIIQESIEMLDKKIAFGDNFNPSGKYTLIPLYPYTLTGTSGHKRAQAGTSKTFLKDKKQASSDEQQGSILLMDIFRAIPMFFKNRQKFDIIFLDPPYYQDLAPRLRSGSMTTASESLTKKTLKTLIHYDIVAPNGLIICRHFKRDILPELFDNLRLIKQAKYGNTVLSFYKKQ